jgi:hypothetical protein
LEIINAINVIVTFDYLFINTYILSIGGEGWGWGDTCVQVIVIDVVVLFVDGVVLLVLAQLLKEKNEINYFQASLRSRVARFFSQTSY